MDIGANGSKVKQVLFSFRDPLFNVFKVEDNIRGIKEEPREVESFKKEGGTEAKDIVDGGTFRVEERGRREVMKKEEVKFFREDRDILTESTLRFSQFMVKDFRNNNKIRFSIIESIAI